MFYPAAADRLRLQLDDLFAAASPDRAGDAVPKALIAPHAGYVYSGPIAASAYARIAPGAVRVKRVVLLGPAHRVPVRGLALPGVDRFDTPFGPIEIDTDAVATISGLPQVVTSAQAHALEHSLEVQLPFLQHVLHSFTLVPLAVGDATADEVADVLERLWGGEDTLIVVSSDLSHYLPYEQARRTDRTTVDAMLQFDTTLDPRQACGAAPVNGLLKIAQRRGLGIELLDLRNSGDTAGDRSRVVGYAALALHERRAAGAVAAEPARAVHAAPAIGRTLLAHARAAIAAALGLPAAVADDGVDLLEPGATFVTLRARGRLRGCVGSVQARRPLVEDVRANALAAAFEDSRFAPIARHEYPSIAIEVSLLSAVTPLAVSDEAELHAQLRPGIDGVTLELRNRQATFLPQVWASLPDPRDFLAHLKRKAGLPADYWSNELRLARYTVEKFAETT